MAFKLTASADALPPLNKILDENETGLDCDRGDREGRGLVERRGDGERREEGERDSRDWGKSAWREMSCESQAAPYGGKRGRDPEEEFYLDNFHSHKRYLSEVMASSLNGLTVGDSLAENLIEYPARSESICYFRDDIASECSPMSEDSDDSRFSDTPLNSTQNSELTGNSSSPISPHRYSRIVAGPMPSATYPPLPSCSLSAVVCSHSRQRGPDNDSRFPSSPNDVCHTADLRRTALLRSVQIRTQWEEKKQYLFMKDDVDYQSPEAEAEDYIEDCSSVDGLNEFGKE